MAPEIARAHLAYTPRSRAGQYPAIPRNRALCDNAPVRFHSPRSFFHITRDATHRLEKRLIEEFAPKCGPDEWTIIDGGVRKGEFVELPRTIGVAKSFDRTPTFTVRKGNKGTIRKDISLLLSRLEYGGRTVAFFAHGGKVAFWYVRLRQQGEVDYPLMGVVKVEFPTPNQQPIRADLADELSSALIGERNVTPHGLDKRWHAHLYPIFSAERVIKANFFTETVLLASIRWPRRQPEV